MLMLKFACKWISEGLLTVSCLIELKSILQLNSRVAQDEFSRLKIGMRQQLS